MLALHIRVQQLNLLIRVCIHILRLHSGGKLVHHGVLRDVGLQTGKVSVVITEAKHLERWYLLHRQVMEAVIVDQRGVHLLRRVHVLRLDLLEHISSAFSALSNCFVQGLQVSLATLDEALKVVFLNKLMRLLWVISLTRALVNNLGRTLETFCVVVLR